MILQGIWGFVIAILLVLAILIFLIFMLGLTIALIPIAALIALILWILSWFWRRKQKKGRKKSKEPIIEVFVKKF